MSTSPDRRDLAREIIVTLPGWGYWVNTLRDFETPFGKIGFRQASIMWELRYRNQPEEHMTPSFIAATTNVAPSVITRAVDKMEAAGLVVREASAQDARRHLIRLTDRGHAASEWIEEMFLETIEHQLGELDADDVHSLNQALTTLSDILTRLRTTPLQKQSD